MPNPRRTRATIIGAITLCAVTLVSATACSSNDEKGASVQTWCNSIKELDHRIDTGEGAELDAQAEEAAQVEAFQSLAEDAPEEIAPAMTAVAAAAEEAMNANDAGTDPDPAIIQAGTDAASEITDYVKTNCDGYDLGGQ